MKKYYAVIDTNVVVSSMLRRESIPGKVIDYVLAGRIIPLLNGDIFREYMDVLTRNKFNFSQKEIDDLAAGLKEKAIFMERTPSDEIFPDEDDAVFFEIALSGRPTMDAYLITGNIKHFPVKSFVVTPHQMVEIIESDAE